MPDSDAVNSLDRLRNVPVVRDPEATSASTARPVARLIHSSYMPLIIRVKPLGRAAEKRNVAAVRP